MKLAYNIAYPAVHILALCGLLVAGFARMLAWLRWFWVNDLVYLLLAVAVLSGLWLAVLLGSKKALLDPRVLQTAAVATYILSSIQLALVCAWVVWDVAVPFLSKVKTFSPLVLAALLPVAAVNVCTMVLQQKITRTFGQTDEKS